MFKRGQIQLLNIWLLISKVQSPIRPIKHKHRLFSFSKTNNESPHDINFIHFCENVKVVRSLCAASLLFNKIETIFFLNREQVKGFYNVEKTVDDLM